MREIKFGYNKYLEENDAHKMFLDVGILKLRKGQTYLFENDTKEKAILIWKGHIKAKIKQAIFELKRKSIWEDPPMALHVACNQNILIESLEESEMVLQAKTNDKLFQPKIYNKANCHFGISGTNYQPSTSVRYVIDIFNYNNAPYSKMVLGEVITKSGHWSGYPPHNHNQPEVYIYRFNKLQGFGVGLAGDEAKIVKNYDSIYIPGGKMHQNACAPGYQMYFTWMIPHLQNDPWQSRNYDKDHEWVNANNLNIKDSKEIKY